MLEKVVNLKSKDITFLLTTQFDMAIKLKTKKLLTNFLGLFGVLDNLKLLNSWFLGYGSSVGAASTNTVFHVFVVIIICKVEKI